MYNGLFRFSRYRLTGKWKDECKERGTYKILVTADTRALNKPIDQQAMDLYIANTGTTSVFRYTFLGHFTGELSVQVD